MHPAYGVWADVCGSDLVRDDHGMLYVLEDNLRVASGVAYMSELFMLLNISPVNDYSAHLASMLASLRPELDNPNMVLLTPGIYNSTYFEHASLVQQAGSMLLERANLT
ncbi:MAG: circularly permuted type 2 ATP-grasp protein [Methylophaga sp.]|nr:circularly permuted type 2 ATP-grasp protein [Methylophaga sp.]